MCFTKRVTLAMSALALAFAASPAWSHIILLVKESEARLFPVMIRQATKTIDVRVKAINDDRFVRALTYAANHGAKVRVVVDRRTRALTRFMSLAPLAKLRFAAQADRFRSGRDRYSSVRLAWNQFIYGPPTWHPRNWKKTSRIIIDDGRGSHWAWPMRRTFEEQFQRGRPLAYHD